jgi:hypothetical protein
VGPVWVDDVGGLPSGKFISSSFDDIGNIAHGPVNTTCLLERREEGRIADTFTALRCTNLLPALRTRWSSLPPDAISLGFPSVDRTVAKAVDVDLRAFVRTGTRSGLVTDQSHAPAASKQIMKDVCAV